MAVDIDMVLLGNERAMEPVYDGPSPMTGLVQHRQEQIDLADGVIDRLTHPRQECEYDKNGNRIIPLNPYWTRPGDGLYWDRGSVYRNGLADVYYGDGGLESTAVRYVEPQEYFNDTERCQVCKARAIEGHTRCKWHPWSIFDSTGRMHDYPKVHAGDLGKPYWEYSQTQLEILNDPAEPDWEPNPYVAESLSSEDVARSVRVYNYYMAGVGIENPPFDAANIVSGT